MGNRVMNKLTSSSVAIGALIGALVVSWWGLRKWTTRSLPEQRPSTAEIHGTAAVQLGDQYQRIIKLLASGNAEDISEHFGDTPATRIVATKRNREVLLKGLGFSDEACKTITVEDLNAMMDRKTRPGIPRFAQLGFWQLPCVGHLEVLAGGEEEGELSIKSMRIFPDGVPKDKRVRGNSGFEIDELRLTEGKFQWRPVKKPNKSP